MNAPELTADQIRRLHSLLDASLAARGLASRPAEDNPAALRVVPLNAPEDAPDSPYTLLLDNMAHFFAAAETPEEEREVVESFVASFVDASRSDEELPTDREGALDRLKMRIAHRGLIVENMALPAAPTFHSTVWELPEPMVCTLIDDRPDSIATYTDEMLRSHGLTESAAVLQRIAGTNTLAFLLANPPGVDKLELDGDAELWAVESEHSLGNAAALFPSDTLAAWVPGVDLERGILISVPERSLILVAPVTAGARLAEAARAMIAASANVYEQQPYSISPVVYLMRDTPEGLEWVPVGGPQQAADGGVEFTLAPTDYLMGRLNEAF